MSSDQIFLLKIVAATLVAPSVGYFTIRQTRPGQRPLAARLAAWLCMWVSQLAVIMLFDLYLCVAFGREWWMGQDYAATALYAGAVGALTVFLFVCTVRVFVLGTLALGRGTDDAVSALARKLRTHGLVAIAAVIAYWLVIIYGPTIPGGWGALAYLVFVTIPVTLTAGLVALIGLALVGPPWRLP